MTTTHSTSPAIRHQEAISDIYFGPAAPEGKENNWIRMLPGQDHFVWIRVYGLLEPFFDQTLRPDDIVTFRFQDMEVQP